MLLPRPCDSWEPVYFEGICRCTAIIFYLHKPESHIRALSVFEPANIWLPLSRLSSCLCHPGGKKKYTGTQVGGIPTVTHVVSPATHFSIVNYIDDMPRLNVAVSLLLRVIGATVSNTSEATKIGSRGFMVG